MSDAAFKLESFSISAADSPAESRGEALAHAFRSGLAEGRAMGFAAELRALTEGLGALRARLDEVAAIRAEAERETLAAIMPILNQIVTSLAGRGEAAGLEAALSEELIRLAGQGVAPGWHIRCPPGMEAMIRRCAREAGIAEPDLRLDPAADEASIILDQGRSAFSTAGVARHFHELIAELQEEPR